jgi:hypothetical protein
VYNLTTLATCLAPLLWFRQSPEQSPDEPQLATTLLASTDPKKPVGPVAMQDVHPLLSVRNIHQAAPEVPGAGADIAAQLSAYLDQLRTAAVGKVLAEFTTRKKLAGAGKTVLQDAQLTGQSGEFARKIIKQSRFVGFALRVLTDTTRDVAVTISSIGTQLSEVNPDFRLFLFHSSQSEAVASYPLPRTSRVYFEWTAIEIPLSQYEGGEWCLGYFEDDLLGQAVDLQHDFGSRPGTCCGSDYIHFDKWAPYVQVRGFSVPEAWAEPGMWSGTVYYVPSTNFGLNLKLSAACDLSDYFCRHRELFTTALQLQLAVDLLNTMAYTTRNNGLSAQTQTLALVELNNKPDHQPGLLSKLDKALGALDVDLSGISRPCLPCTKTNGARWGSV